MQAKAAVLFDVMRSLVTCGGAVTALLSGRETRRSAAPPVETTTPDNMAGRGWSHFNTGCLNRRAACLPCPYAIRSTRVSLTFAS